MVDRKMETRAQLGAAPITPDTEGVFEGHITLWDQVDSYNSTFKRGAFKKTLKERGEQIKVLWNHADGDVIGKIIDAREDAQGVFVRGKLTLDVARAQEVRALMLDGVITALSFGFNSIQDKYDSGTGLRTISEVRLLEVSPVPFPANEQARIASVRSQEFGETISALRLGRGGQEALEALHTTLMDLWWVQADLAAFDVALESFHAEYLAWVSKIKSQPAISPSEMMRSSGRSIRAALYEAIEPESLDAIAAKTSLTLAELHVLRSDQLLPMNSRAKLIDLPPSVGAAHATRRAEKILDLCTELRASGLSDAERTRFTALLSQSDSTRPAPSIDPAQSLDPDAVRDVLAEIEAILRGQDNG